MSRVFGGAHGSRRQLRRFWPWVSTSIHDAISPSTFLVSLGQFLKASACRSFHDRLPGVSAMSRRVQGLQLTSLCCQCPHFRTLRSEVAARWIVTGEVLILLGYWLWFAGSATRIWELPTLSGASARGRPDHGRGPLVIGVVSSWTSLVSSATLKLDGVFFVLGGLPGLRRDGGPFAAPGTHRTWGAFTVLIGSTSVPWCWGSCRWHRSCPGGGEQLSRTLGARIQRTRCHAGAAPRGCCGLPDLHRTAHHC